MSEERDYLKKLFEARRESGATDEELETIAGIVARIESTDEPPPAERKPEPRAEPVTPADVLQWAEQRSASEAEMMQGTEGCSAQSVLAKLATTNFRQDYADWDKDELYQLVCDWDKGGCKGWDAYSAEELAETIAELVNETDLTLEQWVAATESEVEEL